MDENTHTTNESRSSGFDARTVAVIAYLTIIGLIIAFLLNNEKKDAFASYHIKQSLGLTVASLALFVIGMLPILGWIISFLGSILLLVLWIMGLINAANHKKEPVPLLGKYFEDWFRNMQI